MDYTIINGSVKRLMKASKFEPKSDENSGLFTEI